MPDKIRRNLGEIWPIAMRWPLLLSSLLLYIGPITAMEPVDMVYPPLDSANSRWFYFDSASLPFGMVNLSPDTEVEGAWGSGYRYDVEEVKGLSHVHGWQLSGVSVMPISSDADIKKLKDDYYSSFSHATEVVSPGYHRLHLDRYAIDVELTATTRVGFHRYGYPAKKDRKVLIKLGGKLGPSEMINGRAELVGRREISGYVDNGATFRRPKPTRVFFHAVLDQDVTAFSGWRGGAIQENQLVSWVEGRDAGAVINLGQAAGKSQVHMKVAISYVSAEKARFNLKAELPGWNFDQVRQHARSTWNEALGKIRVSGGSQQQRARFYTDLWHSLQGRRIVSDHDGEYLDNTGAAPRSRRVSIGPSGKPLNAHYNSDSFWGAQWTIQTLWPLAYPARTSDFIRSFLNYYKDGGLFPRGPAGGNYTYVMVGASSTPFVVSAWQKGIRNFDQELAYAALRKNHMAGGIMERSGYERIATGGGGLGHYIAKGYVPYPPARKSRGLHRQGAGMTLEYAYQDWALAEFAEALGKDADVLPFRKRSMNWRNLFDPESGYIRPKNAAGKWRRPFDPFDDEAGFVESNAAQASWFVPHDVPGLADAMGGCDVAAKRLNESFEAASELGFTSGISHEQEAHPEFRRIPINYGNQPSIQTAFMFNLFGKPWLTQYWSREIVEAVYSGLSPYTGYNGDEDQGLMGANAVLMKIGLYQIDGGVANDPIYLIGSSIFDEVSIQLDSDYYPGKEFTLRTINNSKKNRYVDKVELNGKEIQRLYIRHSEIVKGGELRLHMSDSPNTRALATTSEPGSCSVRS